MRNLSKLHLELEKARLPVVSVSEDSIQYGLDPYNPVELTPEQLDVADAVIAAHDPTDTIGDRQKLAKSGIIDEFKTATGAQAQAWISSQVVGSVTEEGALAAVDSATTLAQMKPIVKTMISSIYSVVSILGLMARVLIAYRDHIWPDLADS